jgi:hypothetical protein
MPAARRLAPPWTTSIPECLIVREPRAEVDERCLPPGFALAGLNVRLFPFERFADDLRGGVDLVVT